MVEVNKKGKKEISLGNIKIVNGRESGIYKPIQRPRNLNYN